MKYLVAGLGNIGQEYELTRHNAGFLVLDMLADNRKITFSEMRLAQHATYKLKGRIIHLIKPSTYMNLSGKAVRYWLQKLDINIQNILIVVDDVALAAGKIRLRKSGSDGGHNGLKSIDELLETNKYSRLRFGIGNDFPKGQQSDFVLGNWTDDEIKIIQPRLKVAAEAVESFALQGVDRTMTMYNS